MRPLNRAGDAAASRDSPITGVVLGIRRMHVGGVPVGVGMKKNKPKVRLYKVVSEAVSTGVKYGVNRAHKHTDCPSIDHIIEQVENAVLNELSEVLEYD